MAAWFTKEFMYDMRMKKGTPDLMDILYNTYGLIAGITIVSIFELIRLL